MGGSSSHNMAPTPPFVVSATAKHTASVIFLHGLGDTGQGWSQAFSMIKQPHVKYICPNASTKPVTLNAGMHMPSWFDLFGLSADAQEDEAGIKEAANLLQALVAEEEKAGIPRNRIVVGGFSQGGAAALYSAFSINKPPLAAVLALSTWLPLHKSFPASLVANQVTPVLQCHGESDPLVPLNFGKMTAQLLLSFNTNHEFKTYKNMGHSSSDDEMSDVGKFLKKIIPAV